MLHVTPPLGGAAATSSLSTTAATNFSTAAVNFPNVATNITTTVPASFSTTVPSSFTGFTSASTSSWPGVTATNSKEITNLTLCGAGNPFIKGGSLPNPFSISRPRVAAMGTTTITTIGVGDLEEAEHHEPVIKRDLTKNMDVLALKLKQRRSREELVNQGIIPPLKTPPAFHEQRQRLVRAQVGDHLQRKIRMRPERDELVKHHILEDTKYEPLVHSNQMRLKRARLSSDLNEKIRNRPGPLELIEGNILKTEPAVEDAVKSGDVPFLKTNSLDVDADVFNDDTQEISDDALSPPQPMEAVAPGGLASIPSPPDSLAFLTKQEDEEEPDNRYTILPQQHTFTFAPTGNANTVTMSTSSLTNAINRVTQVVNQQQQQFKQQQQQQMQQQQAAASLKSGQQSTKHTTRKNKQKKTKPKEIKFHEYKPPNEQHTKSEPQPSMDSSYSVLLQQQQLFLQLQLQLQQQQQGHFILPNPPINPQQPITTAQLQQLSHQTTSTATVTTATVSTSSSIGSPSPTSSTPQSKQTICKSKSTTNLEDMKVPELKAELKIRGLPVSGNKQQLVERLRTSCNKLNNGSTSATTSSNSTTTFTASSASTTATTDASNLHKVASAPNMITEDSLNASLNSAPGSLSSPPVSPGGSSEYSHSINLPNSPMSVADPMSPPQVIMHTQHPLTANITQVVSPAQKQTVTVTQPTVQPVTFSISAPATPTPSTTVSSLAAPMDIDSNSNMGASTSGGEMMDITDFDFGDLSKSNEILIHQRRLIGALQEQLRSRDQQLFEMQRQTIPEPLLSNPPSPQSAPNQAPPPPPPPPPPHPLNFFLDSEHTLPSTLLTPTTQQAKVKSQVPPVPNLFEDSEVQVPNQQHPLIVTLPDGHQTILFTTATGQPVTNLSNSSISKSASLPSSPTGTTTSLETPGIPRSTTNPSLEDTMRLPSYYEAVSLKNGNKSGKRAEKDQYLEDLLETLIQNGYNPPPSTPRHFDVHSFPTVITSTTTATPTAVVFTTVPILANTTPQNIPSKTIILNQPVTVATKPSSLNRQAPPALTINSAINALAPSGDKLSQSLPRQVLATELPMDVDNGDPSLAALDLSTSDRDMLDLQNSKIDTAGSKMPKVKIEPIEIESQHSPLGSTPSIDSELNWLDLVIPGSATGLTPVSGVPPAMNFSLDPSSALGSDPFSINFYDLADVSTPTELYHLEGDQLDNIPID
ncbi:uncharacterized protein LOC100374790 [Saccoglossus kowalevskii]|uniref:MKL/myocardin-like protein 2-like n=1 Tax=Saccoglossus kowalevskii TaxID=10224 RepID=A0ABM0GWP4_SACKO|nr:PREDICTED: MKL/myocardin-like protein 2-like [Saccoglossus kowalevskii]